MRPGTTPPDGHFVEVVKGPLTEREREEQRNWLKAIHPDNLNDLPELAGWIFKPQGE